MKKFLGVEPEYKKKQKTAKEHRERAEQHQALIQSMKRVADEQEATRDQHERHERGKRRRECSTIVAISATAVIALLTLMITHFDTVRVIEEARTSSETQHSDTVLALAKTDKAIEESHRLAEAAGVQADAAKVGNRAWISPRFVSIDGAIKDGQPIGIRVLYDNAGKTPALNVEFRAEGRYIATTDGTTVLPELYRNARMGENLSCQITDVTYAGVVYPTSNQVGYISNFFAGDSTTAEKVKSRTMIVVIQGCYTYRTLDTPHTSRFCSYLEPIADKPIEQWAFKDCADGQDAN